MTASALHGRLERWIAGHYPDVTNLAITPFGSASSGTSNETRLFTLTYHAPHPQSERLVLRTVPAGRGLFPHYDLSIQSGVMRALGNAGLPVPVVRWFEPNPDVIGAAFIIMDHVDGDVPTDTPPAFHGRGLFFDASEVDRANMWWESVDAIIAVQMLDWRSLNLPPLPGMAPEGERWIDSHVAHFRSWLDWAEAKPLPVIERGLAWLTENIPANRQRALLWGDARPGNILYRDGKVAALLDWELATIGMPECDIAYMIWSAESLAEVHGTPRLQGLPSREETYARYCRLTGKDPAVMHAAEIYTLTQISIMTTLGAKASLNEHYAAYLERNVTIRNLANLLG